MAFTHHEDTAEHVKGPYRWRTFDPEDQNITDGTAEEAAAAMNLAVEEVEWACEEYGRCDTQYPDEPGIGIVCWCPGEAIEGTDGEVVAGGWEWPVCDAPREHEHRPFGR